MAAWRTSKEDPLSPVVETMLAEPLRRRIGSALAVDADILSMLLFRGWSVGAGVALLIVVPIWLDPTEQGYFYAFASILAAQVFFELGLNQVVIQVAGREHALHQSSKSALGNSVHMRRLVSLNAFLRKWYAIAALLFLLIVGPGGAIFFQQSADLVIDQWLGPWLAVSTATAANLYLSASLTVREGRGQVGAVARMRAAQSMIGYATFFIALAAGMGLWAVAALPGCSALFTTAWLFWRRNDFASPDPATYNPDPAEGIVWRRDIFPLQWRIALSWASGYFLFQLFTPLTFSYHGAAEAGRLGITIAVFSSILTVSISWITAKYPLLVQHVALEERVKLDQLFWTVTSRSVAISAVGGCAVLIVLGIGQSLPISFFDRFSTIAVSSLLACSTVVNAFVHCAATYMRAHKLEPMLPVSLLTAILTAIGAFVAIRASVSAMIMVYCTIVVVVTLPWTVILLRQFLRHGAR